MKQKIFFVLTVFALLSTTQQISANPEIEDEVVISFGDGQHGAIPAWVDQSFKWYAQEQISQTELVNALEFLVKESIIEIPSTVQTAQAQDITDSMEELQLKIQKIENKIDEIGIEAKSIESQKDDLESHMNLVVNEFKKLEMTKVDEIPSIPAGSMSTYVKYEKGIPENYRLTVECDAGDVATGGGFATLPSIEPSYVASMPYPTNYADMPRMNNPTGWTLMTTDSTEARVWVVCLDLTPSTLSTGTSP